MKIHSIQFQYFNQEQNLYITAEGDNLIPKFDQVIEVAPGERMHIGENEYGVVNFGLWYDEVKKRPGHGGFWSSREAIVGPMIGKRLVHVSINRVSSSMTHAAVEALLPDEYFIEPRESSHKEKGKVVIETTYHIKRKDGNNEATPSNRIITGLVPSYRYG